MKSRFLLASAAVIGLTFAAPAFAAEDVPQTQGEVIVQDTHNLMTAMMAAFQDAFERAGLLEEKTSKDLMKRIDASIEDFISTRYAQAQYSSVMADLSPDARQATRAFLDSGAGQEFVRALPARQVTISYANPNELSHEDHEALMTAVIASVMKAAEDGAVDKGVAEEIAHNLHSGDH